MSGPSKQCILSHRIEHGSENCVDNALLYDGNYNANILILLINLSWVHKFMNRQTK